jgi:hypothetical protein
MSNRIIGSDEKKSMNGLLTHDQGYLASLGSFATKTTREVIICYCMNGNISHNCSKICGTKPEDIRIRNSTMYGDRKFGNECVTEQENKFTRLNL